MSHPNPDTPEFDNLSKGLVVAKRNNTGESNTIKTKITDIFTSHKTIFKKKPVFGDRREPVFDAAFFEREETVFSTPNQIKKLDKGHRLIVLSGDLSEKAYFLKQTKMMIGRDKGASIRINEKSVSLYHAMICIKAKTCILKDLNSKNGTLVNGYPIQESRKLRDGDRIKIGTTLFTFIHGDPGYSSGKRKLIINTTGMFITIGAIIMSLFFSFNQIKASDSLPVSSVEHHRPDAPPAAGKEEIPASTEISMAQQASGPVQEKPASLEEHGQHLIQKALQYYINGNIPLSLNMLQETLQLELSDDSTLKANALAIKNTIMMIYKLYEEGLKQYKANNMGQAMEIWSQALQTDQNIVGHTSSFLAVRIAGYTGDLFYRLAQDALNKGDKEKAQKYCSQTFRILDNHEGCSAIMNALSAGSEQ